MSGELTLAEKIYDELYQDITKQRIKCGQTLTLSTLKERFNVSHTPIREALSRLSSDGLLIYTANKGMKVVDFTEIEIREIFRFSAELEALAVMFCKESFAKAPMIAELNNIITLEEKAVKNDDTTLWDEVGGEIHNIFYKYADNRYLREAAERTGARMDLLTTFYANDQTIPDIHIRHIKIVEAIIADDFETAAKLAKEHLQFSMIDAIDAYWNSTENK